MAPRRESLDDARQLGRIGADLAVPIGQAADCLGTGLVGTSRQRRSGREAGQAARMEQVGDAVLGAGPSAVSLQSLAHGLIEPLAQPACRDQQRASARSKPFRADGFVHSVPSRRASP